MNINLATYAVRDNNGELDQQATMDKFATDLDTFIVGQRSELGVIAEAVDAVFEAAKENGTVNLNKPYVVGQALVHLNISAHPQMQGILTKRIQAYLSDNSQGEKDKVTGLVPRPDSLFVTARGRSKDGSIWRRADRAADSE